MEIECCIQKTSKDNYMCVCVYTFVNILTSIFHLNNFNNQDTLIGKC